MILPEPEANRLLVDDGIPVIQLTIVDNIEHAARIASEMGYTIELKFLSAIFVQKSEVGGVRLNLFSKAYLVRAYDEPCDLRENRDRVSRDFYRLSGSLLVYTAP